MGDIVHRLCGCMLGAPECVVRMCVYVFVLFVLIRLSCRRDRMADDSNMHRLRVTRTWRGIGPRAGGGGYFNNNEVSWPANGWPETHYIYVKICNRGVRLWVGVCVRCETVYVCVKRSVKTCAPYG